MGDDARPKRIRGIAAKTRLQEAAEAAARAGGELLRARSESVGRPLEGPQDGARVALRAALADAQARLRAAEERHARVLARISAKWEKERSALEMQMTSLVQEIGAAKHIVERADEIEHELAQAREALAGRAAAEIAWAAERDQMRAAIERLSTGVALAESAPAGPQAAIAEDLVRRAAVAGGA